MYDTHLFEVLLSQLATQNFEIGLLLAMTPYIPGYIPFWSDTDGKRAFQTENLEKIYSWSEVKVKVKAFARTKLMKQATDGIWYDHRIYLTKILSWSPEG